MGEKGFDINKQGLGVVCLAGHTDETVMTGRYELDLYGCWWECLDPEINMRFWVIGEYPTG